MNKRGDVAILVLIIFFVLLFISTGFIFVTNQDKVSVEIQDARFVENVYLKEELIDFYVLEAVDIAFREGYDPEMFDESFKKNILRFNKDDISVNDSLVSMAGNVREEDFSVGDEIRFEVRTQIVDKVGKITTIYPYEKEFVI